MNLAISTPKFVTGIKDILHGLQGDTSGLAERGIDLGSGTGVFTPGNIYI